MMEDEGATWVLMEGRAAIESEPKTLSFRQMKRAREAALYVLNTSTVEEALRIFTEGLVPVICCGRRLNIEEETYDLQTHDNRDELRPLSFRDTVSAPF